MLQYLTDHNDRELTNHILNYKMLVETEGKSTLGIRMNLELIKNRYDIFRKEYETVTGMRMSFLTISTLIMSSHGIPSPNGQTV